MFLGRKKKNNAHGTTVYIRTIVYMHQIKVVVYVIIIYQWIQVTVTPESCVKRVICKTWTGTLANSAYQDQTPRSAASDQGMDCLLKLQEVKG